jgi:hypothetical protein
VPKKDLIGLTETHIAIEEMALRNAITRAMSRPGRSRLRTQAEAQRGRLVRLVGDVTDMYFIVM